MASCMGTGQAAGAAAAQSLKEGGDVRSIDTARLVDTVRGLGAII